MLVSNKSRVANTGRLVGNGTSTSETTALKPSQLSILLLDTRPRFTLPVLRGLGTVHGVRIHVLALQRWSELRCSRWIARYHVYEGGDDEQEYLDAVRAIIRNEKIDVLLPVYEDAIRFVSRHRSVLEAFCHCALTPPVEILDRVTDKWKLASLLDGTDIPLPESILLTDTSVLDAAALPRFPVLLKPLIGQGGRQIVKVESFEDLSRLYRQGRLRPEGQVVQRYVKGYDIDCSVLCRDGEILAHTIQSAIVQHPVPFAPAVGVTFGHDEQTLQIVRALMKRLQWNGVANMDLRKEEDTGTVFLLEINPRFWMSLLGSIHAGVNFPYLACLAARGEGFEPPEVRPGPFVWRFQTAAKLLLTGDLLFRHKGLTFGRTVLRYSASDPGPEAYALSGFLFRREG